MADTVRFVKELTQTQKVKELHVTFTDKNVSDWGDMKLMKDMLDSIGIKEFMNTLDLPEKGSNRGYEPIQIIPDYALEFVDNFFPSEDQSLKF